MKMGIRRFLTSNFPGNFALTSIMVFMAGLWCCEGSRSVNDRRTPKERAHMKNTQRKPTQLDRIEVELQHQNEKLDQILRVIARRRRTTPRRDSACGRGEVTAA